MPELTIDSDRLKTIRKARKIGRPKLAKLSGMTERRLAKIEASPQSRLSDVMVAKLSGALQVPELVLTGEFPLTEEDLRPMAEAACTKGCCG